MNNRVLGAALLLLPIFAAVAQPPSTVDPKAKQVLDSVAAFYKGLNTVTCN